MKKTFTQIILLSSLFIFSFSGHAETIYKDIIVSNNTIWALKSDGSIKLIDAESGKPIDRNISADKDIILITKDQNGKIVTANKRKQIKKYNEEGNSWETIAQYDAEPFGILFTSKGLSFSITNKGIQDLASKKFYFSKKSLNSQINYRDSWGKPYCFHIDKNDTIWLGFGYGEWGGNLIAFHTNEKNFIDISLGSFRIELYPIKSFFEDSNSLYISAGLQHMSMSGIILKVDNQKVSILLKSETEWSRSADNERVKKITNGEYIGPATYSPFDDSIYFYSQNGIFRGNKKKDLAKIDNWEKVVSPKLTWKYGQPDAVGSPMNLLKICILDKTRFVFLSQNDGIGLFDGQKISMF